MNKLVVCIAAILLLAGAVMPASAETIRGNIVRAEGHVSPNCRIVTMKRLDNGQLMSFRIAGTGKEDGILAVVLTALTTGLDVEVTFFPSVTTGCGNEPRIEYVTIFSAS